MYHPPPMNMLFEPMMATRRSVLKFGALAASGWTTGLTLAQSVQLRPVSVLAASDLSVVWPHLMRGFQKVSPGINVRVSFGSSGNFLRQIREGLEYDLFLTADAAHAPLLIHEKRAFAQSRPWIKGGLALCYRQIADIPTSEAPITQQWVRQVVDQSRWLAIANPNHAPYGKAAQQALQSWGLWERVQARLVVADSAAQAAQFLFQGAAQTALLPVSLVATPLTQGHQYWRLQRESLGFAVHRVPSQAYQSIVQAMVLSNLTTPAAIQLSAYLGSSDALTLLEQYGFERLESH